MIRRFAPWMLCVLLAALACTAHKSDRPVPRLAPERNLTEAGRPPERPRPPGPYPPQGQPSIQSIPGSDVRVHDETPTVQEEETSMAADPTDPNVLVALYQDDTIYHSWTADGGQTWQSAPLDPSETYFDPAVAADSQGNFYATMISRGGDLGSPPARPVVFKSTDGGASFGGPVGLPDVGGDKPYLAIDPVSGDVHVVYANNPSGDLLLFHSKSVDGGASFSTPLQINEVATNGNGAVPAIGPAGEIYVAWAFNSTSTVWFDRSFDGGTTWEANDIAVATYVPPRSPLNGNFRNPAIPAIAVDRTGGAFNGRIYVVFADGALGSPDIMVARSDDDGTSWSAPVRVNDDAPDNDADQWFPWIRIDDQGAVQITFLDRREDPDGFLFGMYVATSTDGGASFGPNVRVSDGLYGPGSIAFLGDYTGSAISGDRRIHPLWPDGRNGDLDVFTKSVDLDDYDEDGILNDGNLDGLYANQRCTGGQSAGCDDNCPGMPNAAQLDGDGDLVGDLCDNCSDDPNTDQFDRDRDAIGDLCDLCPDEVGGDTADDDGDGFSNCNDNCIGWINADQTDTDGDGQGDACDPFPTDADNDGIDAGIDNCDGLFNRAQLDGDGDGVGNLCDVCPGDPDPGQEDRDGDGRGDACDCQPDDPNDLDPPAVTGVTVSKTGTDAVVDWPDVSGADAYSISRGTLSSLAASQYGDCAAEAIFDSDYTDSDGPASGEGFFYLVQAQNFDCGLGTLGTASDETQRSNADPQACAGGSFSDAFADSEQTIEGTRVGTFADTLSSDDVYEELTEEERNQVGNVWGLLDHRWTVTVAPGRKLQFHVEGFFDGEGFVFEYSDDDGSNWFDFGASLAFGADPDSDFVSELPANLSGPILIRVRDAIPAPFDGGVLNTVFIDQWFVRTID